MKSMMSLALKRPRKTASGIAGLDVPSRRTTVLAPTTQPDLEFRLFVAEQRTADLERFHRLSVGRELQMIDLKKQINELATRLGHESPYDLAFLDGKK